MNYVIDLSESKDCNAILMIIDRLTKMRHYIVYKAGNKETLQSRQPECTLSISESITDYQRVLSQTEIYSLY